MNKKKIELPSGGWVELRDPMTVTVKELKELRRKLREAVDEDEAERVLYAFFITSWSLKTPLPGEDPTAISTLLAPDYGLIDSAITHYFKVMQPDFEVSPDPKAPTNKSKT